MPKGAEPKAVRQIPDAARRIVADGIEQADLWNIIQKCKTNRDFQTLFHRNTGYYEALKRCLQNEDAGLETLMKFSAGMFALGAIRGMQFGRRLERESNEGTIANSTFVKHASVLKLLIKEPKASTLDICHALDKLGVRLPWRELKRENRTWAENVKNPLVKVAITNARKAAMQAAAYSAFVTMLDQIGDDGSIFTRFQLKQRDLKKIEFTLPTRPGFASGPFSIVYRSPSKTKLSKR